MRATIAVLVAVALQPQPPQPPRDTRPPREATGTGTIRGHVVAADTGQPIRKAMVMLSYTPPLPPPAGGNSGGGSGVIGEVVGSGPTGGIVSSSQMVVTSGSLQPGAMMRPRQIATDQNGGFEFTQLPAGTYRVIANSPQYSGQYLGIAYGATRPSGPGSVDPGKTIELSNGEIFDKANIALPRGGVIVGRVTDESGLPMARVEVYGLLYPSGGARGMRMGQGTQTDDLGQFRLFGLQPGEWVVVANARNNTFVQPGTPVPESEEDRTGYLTTFYPSTADEAMAQRVRVAASRETAGIEIRVTTGRMYRISGMVIDSQGQPLSGANGQLAHRTPGATGYSGNGFSTDPQGKFQMQNIPAGEYRLIVRQRMMGPPVNGQPPDPGEMAMVQLTLNGTDVENLLVATSPGTTITGHVVYEPAPPDSSSGRPSLRVFASLSDPSVGMGMPMPMPAAVQPDGSFTMKGLMGEYLLRVTGLQPTWYVKSISAGADDILEAPRAFKQSEDVTVVVSTRAATVDGTVTDAKGEPAADTALVMFGEDKASWRTNSSWTRRSTTTSKGRFHITGLRPGRYYITAVTRDRLNAWSGPSDPKTDAAMFEELAKDATTLVINDDEQRTIDLRVSGGAT